MRMAVSAGMTAMLLLFGGLVDAIPPGGLRLQRSADLSMDDIQMPVSPLAVTNVAPGRGVKPGTELRILCAGDSITYGFLSDLDGGDGNGYRLRLRDDLSKDDVVYAGTDESNGNMTDGYFAAWNGKTIQYIADRIDPSLEQQPNVVLIHAGTNDMNPDSSISTEGNDPKGAAARLGSLIDKVVKACPDAVVLVAMIISTCHEDQQPQTKIFQSLVPDLVASRLAGGSKVLAVDFTQFKTSDLRDCIHPTNNGYRIVGDYWYDFITQIPVDWITAPVGDDPVREVSESGAGNYGVSLSLLSIALVIMIIRHMS